MANKLKVSFLGLGLALVSQSIQGKINFSYSLDLKKNAKELGTKIQSMAPKSFRKDVSKNLSDVSKLGKIVQIMNNLKDDEKNEFQQYCESVALSLTKHAKRTTGKRVFNKSSQYYKGFVRSVVTSSNLEQNLLHNALLSLNNDNKEQTFLLSFADIIHEDLVKSTLDFTSNMQEKLSLKDDGAMALSGGKYFCASKDENNLVTFVSKKGNDDNSMQIDANDNAITVNIAHSKFNEDNYHTLQHINLLYKSDKNNKARAIVHHVKNTDLDLTLNNASPHPVYITNSSKSSSGGYMASFLASDAISGNWDETPKLYKIKLLQETQKEWKDRLSSFKNKGVKNQIEDDNDTVLEDNLQCSEGLGACFNFLYRLVHLSSTTGTIKTKCGQKFMPGSELMLVEGTPLLRRLPFHCESSCATATYLISNVGFTNSCPASNLGVPLMYHHDNDATENRGYVYVMDKAPCAASYLKPSFLNIGTFNVSYDCYGEKREANQKSGLNLMFADLNKEDTTGALVQGWGQSHENSDTGTNKLYLSANKKSTIHIVDVNSITTTNPTGHKLLIKSGSISTDNLSVLPSHGAMFNYDDTKDNYIPISYENLAKTDPVKTKHSTSAVKNGSDATAAAVSGGVINNGYTDATATKLIFGNGTTSRFIMMGNNSNTTSSYKFLAASSLTAPSTAGFIPNTAAGTAITGTSVTTGTEFPATFVTIDN